MSTIFKYCTQLCYLSVTPIYVNQIQQFGNNMENVKEMLI